MCFFEITFGKTNPSAVDKIVITTRALRAPANTMPRECRIASRAAMMNVSSPTWNHVKKRGHTTKGRTLTVEDAGPDKYEKRNESGTLVIKESSRFQ